MANVEHSTLTGSALHEPKGVATASSGQVYVSNGAGSGVWTSLNLSTNPFGTALLHVQDRVSSGIAQQTFTSSTWNQRRLQTVVTNEIVGASLTSNQINLPVGGYFAQGWTSVKLDHAAAGDGAQYNAKARFRNITASSTLMIGQSASWVDLINSLDGISQERVVIVNSLPVIGRFTLGGSTAMELQVWVNSALVSGGMPVTSGESEVYSDLLIWKIS